MILLHRKNMTIPRFILCAFLALMGPAAGRCAEQMQAAPEAQQEDFDKFASQIGLQMIGAAVRSLRTEGEEPPDDAVAVEMEKCIKEHGDTIGHSGCLETAYKQYDRVLNVIYRNLIKTLDVKTKESLIQSQKQWIMFRDKERSARNTYFSVSWHGTITSIVFGYNEIYTIRERILELTMFTGNQEG